MGKASSCMECSAVTSLFNKYGREKLKEYITAHLKMIIL